MQEKIFYNPTFTNAFCSVIAINSTCEDNNTYTYGQVRAEYIKMRNKRPHKKRIANIYKRIKNKDLQNRSDNVMYHRKTEKNVSFEHTTHKDIYNELITRTYKEHHSKAKWEERFPNEEINCNQVWSSLNSPITNEDTKTIIWVTDTPK